MLNRLLLLIFITLGISALGQDGRGFEKSTVEIGPQHLSLKKPPKYDHHSPCEVVFINYTNTPLQISWMDYDGRLRKLYYIDKRDTVRFATKTNHHLIVTYQGFTAATMFVPYADVNICKIHDKFFHTTERIKPKLYKIKSPGAKAARFKHKIKPESYGKGKGPLILVDEAHLNTHTVDGLFKPLTKMLRKDGYKVAPIKLNFTEDRLKEAEILVMANPYGQQVNGWMVDSSQALTVAEINALKSWVRNGGRLLLLVDGQPYPTRVTNIATTFGFEFVNGMVKDTTTGDYGDLHDKNIETLADNVLTQGRNDKEKVDQVATFGGMAMRIPTGAEDIWKFNENWVVFQPEHHELLSASTPVLSTSGLSHGATMTFGEGKVAVFGDPDAFTATKQNGEKVGMNWKYAQDNPKFAMNVFHWLDGFIE